MKLSNLIKLNLNELPNEDCVNLGDEFTTSGKKLSNFRLLLDKKEFGLFDTLHIRVFEDNKMNFTFSTLDNPLDILSRIKLLVKDLYEIYGKDSSGMGLFEAKDEMQLTEGELWFGRSFTEHELYNPISVLSYDNEVGLELTVWQSH